MMSGVDFSGVSNRYQTAAFDRHDSPRASQTVPDGKNGDVRLDSVFKGLADQLKGALDSLGQQGLPYGVTEVTVNASLQRSFEASYQAQGADGSKVSAYLKSQESVSVSMSFKLDQAQKLAEAHAGAATDTGPEATAGRIADFAMSFFPAYAKQHPDMSYEEQVDSYQKMVEGAVDQGFKEAMQILGAVPKEVADGIQQTRDLVNQKLSGIFEYMKGQGADAAKEAMQGGGWKDYVKSYYEQAATTPAKLD
ncbi:MAG: DUF5610 domain-containing protein [Nitrospinae bacterium]|nr:DUF5610 domain-containing protein [Nitrospinota bacterium]